MTKIETFRWRMWHVYLLIFITILLTGTFVRYGYRLQADYSLDDRLYDYTNKKVTVTSFQNVKIGNFNVLGVKFGNEKAGIAKGTKFDDLPDEWVCPVCGEGKDMFQIHE